MHSASKGSLELLASEAAALAAGAGGGERGLAKLGMGEQDKQRLWERQSPWLQGPPEPLSDDPQVGAQTGVVSLCVRCVCV